MDAATKAMLRKPGQGSFGRRGGTSGEGPGKFMLANDSLDALTQRLTDESQHSRIDIGSSGSASGGGAAAALDFGGLPLKADHERRPFWVTPTGAIFLEATSPLYEAARDFLVAICEPVSRPEFVHEYRLDKTALFAAASMGLTSDIICSALNRLSKVPVAPAVLEFIHGCTTGYGKVKLVLQRGRYFLESSYPAILRLLNRHPALRAARVVYLPDGSRRVGLDGPSEEVAGAGPGQGMWSDDEDEDGIVIGGAATGAGAGAGAGAGGGASTARAVRGVNASADVYGFEVSSALSEADGSVGLRGILAGGDGSGAAELGSLLRKGGPAGDTAGGTLTRRVVGEVDSDEEGEAGLDGDGEAAVANAALAAMLGGGSSSSSSSSSSGSRAGIGIGAGAGAGMAGAAASLAAPAPAPPPAPTDWFTSLAPDLALLRETDVDALLETLREAEAAAAAEDRLAAEASGGGAAGGGGTSGGSYVVSSTAASLAQLQAFTQSVGASVAGAAKPLSFRGDVERLVGAGGEAQAAPGAAAAAAGGAGAAAGAAGAPVAIRKSTRIAAAAGDDDDDDYDDEDPHHDMDAAIAEDQERIAAAEDAAIRAAAAIRLAEAAAARAPTHDVAAALAAGKAELRSALAELKTELRPPDVAAVEAGVRDAPSTATAAATAPDAATATAAAPAAGSAPAPDGGVVRAQVLPQASAIAPAPAPDAAGVPGGASSGPRLKLRFKVKSAEEKAADEAAKVEAAAAKRARAAATRESRPRKRARGSDDDDDEDEDDDYNPDEESKPKRGGRGGRVVVVDSDDDSDDSDGGRKGRGRGAGRGKRGGGRAGSGSGTVAGAGGVLEDDTYLATAASAAVFSHVAAATAATVAQFNGLYRRLHASTSLQSLHTPGRVERFEIDSSRLDDVKFTCARLDPPLPLIQEYDFRGDAALPRLPIQLRNPSALRPYQERSLAKMFGNGRARSGIIVLPCGAGKTFVGIAAATTIGKSTIILCPNQTSVGQWKEQLFRFTDVSPRHVLTLTAKNKEPLPPVHEPVVLLTTYTMIGSGGRSKQTASIMNAIRSREWGCMLLDEVHQAVADTFVKALRLRAHCRLGLTATLVREDGRDRLLSLFIGPKLYEANWMDLTRAGFLANVQVCEVWCPMTPEFYYGYLRARTIGRKKALAVMNPVKCAAMDYLIRKHEARGDKIIIFSESVFALRLYREQFGILSIEGATDNAAREAIIRAFKTPNSGVNKLLLSRVGDVALDVPDANVLIQISSHFGSRLQEAQRMGRILRRGTASNAVSGNNAFMYSLISSDTLEVFFANKRRRYLVDQGYAYKVLMADKLAWFEAPAAGGGAGAPGASPTPGAGAAGALADDEVVEVKEGGSSGGASASASAAPAATFARDPVAASVAASAAESEGLRRLFGQATFMASKAQQQSVLETIAMANVEEEESAADALALEFLSADERAATARSERSAVLASSAGTPGGLALLSGTAAAAAAAAVLPATRTLAKPAGRGIGMGAGAGAGRLPGASSSSAGVRVHAGLSELTGGSGRVYLEYTSERSALDALKEAEATAAAERRALQAAAAAAKAAAPAGPAVGAKPKAAPSGAVGMM